MKLADIVGLLGSKKQRDASLYRIAYNLSEGHGFYVYSRHMVWKEQPFFTKAVNRTEGIPGIPNPRSFVLQSCLRSISNVDGDIAECGTRRGRSTLFMIAADEKRRHFHLFDSFQGLSNPTEQDRKRNGKMGWKAGDLTSDEKHAREAMADCDRVTFHVGWIPTTFPEVSDRRFALVHIDVDLYEPTRDSLAFFYDRVKPNGIIVCDDYGSALCPGARKAFDEFFSDRPEGIIELPTGQAIIVKRA